MLKILMTSHADSANQLPANTLPAIHLGLLSFRLLLLTLLLLSQIPPFYNSSYVPNPSLSRPSERTSLLGSNTTWGTIAPPLKPNPLRSSRPPSNRPPDPSSLSLLTLFTRVKTLFPYLWPSKSFSLQVLAMICVGLMLVKRFVNVFVPLFFGRVVGDLSAGRRQFRPLLELFDSKLIPPSQLRMSTSGCTSLRASCKIRTRCCTVRPFPHSRSSLS